MASERDRLTQGSIYLLQFSLKHLGYEFPRYRVPEGAMDSFLEKVTYAGVRSRFSKLSHARARPVAART